MATISLRALEVAKTIHGNSPWTGEFPEAASQTFKKGAIVTFNSSGHVVEAGADPVQVLGVAAEDASNDSVAANSKTTVWIADDETIFVGNLSGTSTTAQTDIGAGYGLVKTGNNWHVDKTDVANRREIIVDLDPRDSVGDTNGRVHFIFFGSFRRLSYTS